MSRKKYIDRIDIELLNTLSANPKMTVAELGEEIDLTPGPTHTRLVNLEKIVKNGAVVKEGFFKYTIEIDYSKFSMIEHEFSFQLKTNKKEKHNTNVAKNIADHLVKVQHTLILSVKAFKDESSGSTWIKVMYYPRYPEFKVESEIEMENILSDFIEGLPTFLCLMDQIEVIPELDRGHTIRKKPI